MNGTSPVSFSCFFLREFPAHAGLCLLVRIADRLRQCSPLSSPLAELCAGVEVLLKQAQQLM